MFARIKNILLKFASVGYALFLSPQQQRELTDAHARDLEIARWYAWVYLGGLLVRDCLLRIVLYASDDPSDDLAGQHTRRR